MAITAINVEIIGCEPEPVNGYNVQYQVQGSSIIIDAGNFPAGIAVIPVDYPDGTSFEGTVRADCGDGLFGDPVSWEYTSNPLETVTVVNTSPPVTINNITMPGFTFGAPLVGSGTRQGFHDAFTGTVGYQVTATPISGSLRLSVNASLIECINISGSGTFSGSFTIPITVTADDQILVLWFSGPCSP